MKFLVSLLLFTSWSVLAFPNERMKELLSVKHPSFEGPNCWNSVLYIKGFSPSVNYSEAGEMDFWLNSPLCKVTHELKKGDIIDISHKHWSKKTYRSFHAYIYMSDEEAFTKNGVRIEESYRLDSHQEINKFYYFKDEKCFLKTKQEGFALDCDLVSTGYRCGEIGELVKDLEGSELYSRLLNLGQRMKKKVLYNDTDYEPAIVEIRQIKQEAMKALGMVAFKDLPQDLAEELFLTFSTVRFETDYYKFKKPLAENLYLDAYPSQKVPLPNSKYGKIIEKFKKLVTYPTLSKEKFYYWAHIFHTARNLEIQTEVIQDTKCAWASNCEVQF